MAPQLPPDCIVLGTHEGINTEVYLSASDHVYYADRVEPKNVAWVPLLPLRCVPLLGVIYLALVIRYLRSCATRVLPGARCGVTTFMLPP